jgi:hypothetical protein
MALLLSSHSDRRCLTYSSLVLLLIFFIYLYAVPTHKQFSPILQFDSFEEPYVTSLTNLQWCKENPFLKGYDKQLVHDFESKQHLWNQVQFTRTFNYLKTYAQSPENITGKFPQIIHPVATPLPCPYNNNSMKRYGNSILAGKLLCGLETLAFDDTCMVYSLGSGNRFDFEESILSETRCTVHTFDCTTPPPLQKNSRLHFHNICIGENSPLQHHIYPPPKKKPWYQIWSSHTTQRTYMKFDQILKMLNHNKIHVLKMDIEGGEYSVFADLLKNISRSDLPYQISFETHWWNRDIYHAILHISLFSQLWTSGYRLLQHELNYYDPYCVEWTFIRMLC